MLNVIMNRIEFDTMVEGEGVIRIPASLANGLHKGETVHVTVAPEPNKRWTVEQMQKNPIHAPGFKPLTRDELYDR
jgi:hypothetical protein